ncbi:efflux transporter outer membrane subunit [Fluviibacter phosphoraccumulans]|uniref:efflux transporter outer membrane subunit n=1 Tax=Fluviibacter phosphoraccumulans TaxID=1751046 RepID=UPI0024E21F75|nr:efflux transporter outer membrane subunit [Fluviibacter phosphoraccumulans]
MSCSTLRRRLWLSLASAGMLSACAVGPDYQRPAVAIPDDYRSATPQQRSVQATPATQSTDAALPEDAWWKGFNDPVLDDLVAAGLANNRDLQSAIANVIKTRGQLETTRAQFFPQLGASAGSARGQGSSIGQTIVAPTPTVPLSTTSTMQLPASWQIDLFGGIRRQVEAASATEAAAIANRRAVALSVAGQMTDSYILLRALDQQLVLTRQTLENYRTTLRVFELRLKYGTANMVQVSQIQSQVDQAEASIPPLVKAIAEQENSIRFLAGRNPGNVPRGKSIEQLSLPVPPAGLPSELLARRPDVMRAEQQLIAANAQIGVAKAQYFPSISLTGALGTASNNLISLFSGPGKIWSVGAAATMPIFTAGAIAGQVTSAEAGQQMALAQYQKAVEASFRDVDNALVATSENRKLVSARQQQVGTLKTYANLSSMQFNYGYADYLTVLNAEDSLFKAQLQLVDAQRQEANAILSLYMALGGGWDAADRDTLAANQAITKADGPSQPKQP